ncbi:hypothetical protein CVT26_012960 [Gymnopilus dilepis]|uniref:Uncharacterized protein n=1 Tax=Gymnopilus dilepis TaxID=231916 RepID=A0A409WVG2_9AGAR|nr:hypothetical protein CVT26_012960 [Gymnopilus dilepis]
MLHVQLESFIGDAFEDADAATHMRTIESPPECDGPPVGYQADNLCSPPLHAHRRLPPAPGHCNSQFSDELPPEEATSSSGASAHTRTPATALPAQKIVAN